MDEQSEQERRSAEAVAQAEAEERDRARPRDWGSQMVGAAIGALVALGLAWGAVQMGWISGNLTTYALWGGVIGGLVGGADTLAHAGRRLTHREDRWLNVLVALVGMVVVFGVFFGIGYVVRLLLSLLL